MSSLLVFGSINLDVAIRVPRLPQAGETLIGRGLHLSPGGKGANQAHAARLYGAAVELVGAVGDDGLADAALAGLEAAGVDLGGVRRLPRQATGVATIHVVDGGDNAIVVASGANAALQAAWVGEPAVARAGILLLQQEVPPTESLALARRVKAAGGWVMWNLAPARELATTDGAVIDWLVVNRHELTALGAAHGFDAARPESCAAGIAAAWGCTVIVTLGAEGALACLPDKLTTLRVEGLPTEAVDTTGAGDTFCGVLAAVLLEAQDLQHALRQANAAASLACRHPGAQCAQPSRRDIEELLT